MKRKDNLKRANDEEEGGEDVGPHSDGILQRQRLRRSNDPWIGPRLGSDDLHLTEIYAQYSVG